MRFELLPPVPAVSIASQLRGIPLFRFASVDELFRISAIAHQVRHAEGAVVQQGGSMADYIQILLDGRVSIEGAGEQSPPAIFGFQEVLEGSRLAETVTAVEESICLALSAEDFRNLLSDNIDIAEGLFQMLLGGMVRDGAPSVERGHVSPNHKGPGVPAVGKGLVLQELSVFSRATIADLLDLAGIVKEIELRDGETLFREGDSAALFVVLSGEIALESPDGGERATVEAGDAVGYSEVLAGTRFAWRATVTREGGAFKIEREDLFELLSDHVDLLQGLFGSLIHKDTRRLEEPS